MSAPTPSRPPVHGGVGAPAADGFAGLLLPGAIRAVFQPIVRLSDLEPIGYEGLARFPTPPGLVSLPPDVTLAAAAGWGLRGELEAACWAAMADAGAPPHGRLLFVNVSPDLVGAAALGRLADRLPSRLVIELTEQDAVQDIARVRERLRPWIARGALVAVDDAGAGFTSLEYVAEIRPDFLKLCRGMVTGVDHDVSRQAVLRATVAFAREVGARVVAEGVEREEELAVLREAAVDFGQGWLFGRPAAAWPEDAAPAASPSAPVRQAASREPLERALAAARTVPEACGIAVDHLVRRGVLPSVYLESGGRLRCQAVRGYWQIYDGMPPATGVIGACFRSGDPVVVPDVADSEEFLPSLPSVVAQVCLPLRCRGAVIGVLSAEAPTPPDLPACAEIERTAVLLSARIEALGGPEPASPAQRLARTLAGLVALDDPEDIVRETIAAARGLAGFESALLALADEDGSLYPHHAEGPFAVAFSELDAADLGRLAAWVQEGTSCYTAAEAAGRGFPGHEVMRRAGAGSLAVLPMAAAGRRVGVLVLADRAVRPLSTEAVELLELLALQAAGGLRMAAAVLELRERAARDPLTGLGHHATFHAALRDACGQADGRRCAVLLADIDGFKAINDGFGHAAGDDVLRATAGVLRSVTPPGGRAFRIGGDEFAIVFACGSAGEAQRVGWDLRAAAPRRLGTTLSIGIALAAPDEAVDALVARADTALYDVKRAGRDGVLVAA